MKNDNTNDGGPAFPSEFAEYELNGVPRGTRPHQGMTLLDYFAAKALSVMIDRCASISKTDPAFVAQGAYGIAQAMLIEREKGKS